MPKVKSKAQAGLFGAMYERGELSKDELSKRTKGVKVGKLPKRVAKKKK